MLKLSLRISPSSSLRRARSADGVSRDFDAPNAADSLTEPAADPPAEPTTAEPFHVTEQFDPCLEEDLYGSAKHAYRGGAILFPPNPFVFVGS